MIALFVRPVVLYPVLGGVKLSDRDRRLVAAFGPRGLSSLLLALLPVFAGVTGGERIFMLTSVVVLLSVIVHGGGTAYFLRASAVRDRAISRAAASDLDVGSPEVLVPLTRTAAESEQAYDRVTRSEADTERIDERITIDELRRLQEKSEEVIIVDARAPRNYDGDPLIARGAVRLRPDDPVQDAKELRLSKHATLVIYCA